MSMRVFLCAFRGFLLAVPIDAVSSLMLCPGEAAEAVFEGERGNRCFSLPRLLNLPGELVRHGIVLKNAGGDGDGDGGEPENRNILLTTAVDREADIPGDTIYPLPGAAARMAGTALFSGIRFIALPEGGEAMVLVLDCDFLVNAHGAAYGAARGAEGAL